MKTTLENVNLFEEVLELDRLAETYPILSKIQNVTKDEPLAITKNIFNEDDGSYYTLSQASRDMTPIISSYKSDGTILSYNINNCDYTNYINDKFPYVYINEKDGKKYTYNREANIIICKLEDNKTPNKYTEIHYMYNEKSVLEFYVDNAGDISLEDIVNLYGVEICKIEYRNDILPNNEFLEYSRSEYFYKTRNFEIKAGHYLSKNHDEKIKVYVDNNGFMCEIDGNEYKKYKCYDTSKKSLIKECKFIDGLYVYDTNMYNLKHHVQINKNNTILETFCYYTGNDIDKYDFINKHITDNIRIEFNSDYTVALYIYNDDNKIVKLEIFELKEKINLNQLIKEISDYIDIVEK